MPFITDTETRRYWVIFSDAQEPHWWDMYTRPKFRHCFIVMQAGTGTLQVNYGGRGISVIYGEEPIQEFLGRCHAEGLTICTAFSCPNDVFRLKLELCTCVSIVKDILGIYSPWMYTPFQLYKYLRKQNEKSPG